MLNDSVDLVLPNKEYLFNGALSDLRSTLKYQNPGQYYKFHKPCCCSHLLSRYVCLFAKPYCYFDDYIVFRAKAENDSSINFYIKKPNYELHKGFYINTAFINNNDIYDIVSKIETYVGVNNYPEYAVFLTKDFPRVCSTESPKRKPK